MEKITVVGSTDFTLGFRLAGIDSVIATAKPVEALREQLKVQKEGIIIVERLTLKSMDEYERNAIAGMANPVVLALSREVEDQDDIKQMIKKAIGIEL